MCVLGLEMFCDEIGVVFYDSECGLLVDVLFS